VYNDCGILGQLGDNTVVSSQWIDEDYDLNVEDEELTIEGHLNKMPSTKLFTPLKTIVFRAALVLGSWSSRFSHILKGSIRKILMLGTRPVSARFRRRIQLRGNELRVDDEIATRGTKFRTLMVGGEFFVRYVPQSRYFQRQELDAESHVLEPSQIKRLNEQGTLTISRTVKDDQVTVSFEHPAAESGA
jgi:hypothetical protein